ncbi:MAG TPA: guanylate kinase [Planctomycetes bacterium]|nr:guanylate kinase [Planctomycetota bacterium]
MKSGTGTLLVISGPSGCGKSTICKRLLEDPRVEFSISATTRPMRAGEVDGKDYRFIGKETFRRLIEEGAFIEWAEVHGNLYGTLRAPMEEALARGSVYLVEIDVQGGSTLKTLGLEVPSVFVFIAPPSMEELEARLRGRGTDAPEVIERRLEKAREELLARDKYDAVVVNEDLERAVAEVRRLAGLDAEPGPSAEPREHGSGATP